MKELTIFNYKANEVRTLTINGEPWFVLKDLCDVLDLANPTVVAGRLDVDEVTKFNLGGLSGESNIINESGLFNVILRSDKPEAKQFKRWITHEVLPSIRKTGSYMKAPQNYIQALESLLESEREKERLAFENSDLKIELDESQKYYTIKRVASINGVSWRNIDWKKLKSASQAMECEVKRIFDANYDHVNAYHISVWNYEYPHLRYGE